MFAQKKKRKVLQLNMLGGVVIVIKTDKLANIYPQDKLFLLI